MASQIGVLKNSIRKGEGNLVGCLGEVLVARHLKADQNNTYNYDLTRSGVKLEVKTKECTSSPQPHFNCSVAAYNTKQDCDYYVFVRILNDLKRAWILGYMQKNEFFKKATFNKKGETDSTSSFGWTFRADCYNLPIRELNKFKI